jgi:DNA-binding transcriptional MerR regulator
MASPAHESGDTLLTIDELALSTGLTVRTTRYYASLGLLPTPVRKGRMAYYGPGHLARLHLIRALQDHGFTLAAIERYLENVPMDASPEELAVQRALLTAWKPQQGEDVTRERLDEIAGRPLSEDDLDWLVKVGAVRRGPDGQLRALGLVGKAVETLDLGTPLEALRDANAAVRRHMGELADELTEILQSTIVPQFQREDLSMADAERLERTMANLRDLTLEAIVNAFQRAADQVATKSMTVDPPAGWAR